ncbi:MAG: hypothetical protein HQL32_17435 [Planctomycetes bacterium]|nr:hypothetical protein [Planctomycetota bacterium]
MPLALNKVSFWGLFVVVMLTASSLYWIPSLREELWALHHSFFGDSINSSEPWLDGQALLHSGQGSNIPLLKRENDLLKRENNFLKEAYKKHRLAYKSFAADLRFIQAEIIGPFFRQHKGVWMLNMGSEKSIRIGDLILRNLAVVGKVIGVSEKSCLVESCGSKGCQFFVRIEGLPGEYIWEGKGDQQAIIRVKGKGSGILKGKKVLLSSVGSLGGGLILGVVDEEILSPNAGWKELIVLTRKLRIDDILHIVQETESKSKELFEKRGLLKKYKTKVRELEEIKLRLEMLKN